MELGQFRYFIGVDVGTTSVRAALIDHKGCIKCRATQSIQIWQPKEDYYQQSSENIWQACCLVVKEVTQGIDRDAIGGIGFDATCSMVVLDEQLQPVTISPDANPDCNIVMWLDHRAIKEAELINATEHHLLSYLGGTISPEMQAPKLLWLKKNLHNQCWKKAAHFFDLPDFLSFKATGALTRSLCCLVCKWNYEYKDKQGWLDDFWQTIGLDDFIIESYERIGGKNIAFPGQPIGKGLTVKAASELGLAVGTAVGASLVDAYAGCLGIAGIDLTRMQCKNKDLTSRLSLICGTSTCHMAITSNPHYVAGVWGPFNSVILPGLYLNEGGQSVTGKLVDFMIQKHPFFPTLKELSQEKNTSIYDYLNQFIIDQGIKSHWAYLTTNMHILPDFHGNRSPIANHNLKGMICGLTLASELHDLAIQYLSTLQSLAFGTKQIVEAMTKDGHEIKILLACGGLSKNSLFLRCHADITGCPIVLGKEEDSVLLGSAMLGVSAALPKYDLKTVMATFSSAGEIIQPNLDIELQRYYAKKYQICLQMQQDQLKYLSIINEDK
ncbi:uncharacterized protein TRIADDRAFT_26735 [Trichoplax adhaerens]|uniref:FGGY carbohydrate kinase domain-containing protein n=1 Tax=Trichoplax adhaerens TaxID=10228 RepID=B3RZ00_TRIAD|nr:hypothetical protein TRIADDRAFT_26735 [Trichoplax adhaerens]EDV24115.1 hypothetical protein TRIADDRAFT_26735 [Trichoplax adhaerens]|eukprot:XP_002113641.1 hypothetical protein TRIADDRAFT_26735 [Trichoplax adhaerens]